jgi:hypothetical protein
MIVVLTLAVNARVATAEERTITFTAPRVVAGDPSQLGDTHVLDPTLPLKSGRTLPPGLRTASRMVRSHQVNGHSRATKFLDQVIQVLFWERC